MARRLISSAQPLEARYGYSRAVVADGRVWVSGTVATMPDGGEPPAGAYAQAKRALEIVVAALAEAGARPADVVRTRIYMTRAEFADEAFRAHAEVFGEARPATSGLVVGLLSPGWLVEVEAEAVLE